MSRTRYFVTGAVLCVVKFAVEFTVIRIASGKTLTLTAFVNPLLDERMKLLSPGIESLLVLVGVTIPFLWIAVAMTMRRAIDAGVPAVFTVFTLVPIVNLVTFAALTMIPSKYGVFDDAWVEPGEPVVPVAVREQKRSARIIAIAVPFFVFFAGLVLSVHVFQRYGATLFVVVPVLMGFVGGYLDQTLRRDPTRKAFALALQITGATAAALLVLAFEGALCLMILFPIALPLVWVGVLLGFAAAPIERGPKKTATLTALFVPLLVLLELRAPPPEYEVLSTTTIDAPPERVWQHVVGFTDLPPTNDLFFRLGVAHPLRAHLEGEGVGAIRYCEFSTGPFVEPITVWDPPHRLAFDVARQPHPMHELSPWGTITPPHLEHTLTSRRGEFRLIPLDDGRTRLEGRTWYTLDLWPQAYFKLWADDFIHRIHGRVLDHIERLAEAD